MTTKMVRPDIVAGWVGYLERYRDAMLAYEDGRSHVPPMLQPQTAEQIADYLRESTKIGRPECCCHCGAGITVIDNNRATCANKHVIPESAMITKFQADGLLPSFLRRYRFDPNG